jgi:hypothetical protein
MQSIGGGECLQSSGQLQYGCCFQMGDLVIQAYEDELVGLNQSSVFCS